MTNAWKTVHQAISPPRPSSGSRPSGSASSSSPPSSWPRLGRSWIGSQTAASWCCSSIDLNPIAGELARLDRVADGGQLVLQPWVLRLSPKQQVSLLAAVRGPDDGNPVGKELTRRIRHVCLIDVDKKTSSAHRDPLDLSALEYSSMHFAVHAASALKKIAKVHPEEAERSYWASVSEELSRVGRP